MQKGKITIVGAGSVGSATAFALALSGLAEHIVLQDVNFERAESEALDITHGALFYPSVQITPAADASVAANSQVVVITAGARQKPNQTRIELAGDSINIMKSALPGLLNVAPDAIYLIVANPVDVVTYACQEIAREHLPNINICHIFGSGTALDSSRLRTLLAKHTSINSKNIHAYIAGEHGDSEITLWSSATIGNTPLLEFKELPGTSPLTADVRELMHSKVVNAAYKVINGKGATNYAIAATTVDILTAIMRNERRIMPVSARTSVEGIENVCMSLPAIVGQDGACHELPVALSRDEILGLQASAKILRNTLSQFGY